LSTKKNESFDSRFHALTGHSPFGWQKRLFRRMVEGDVPEECSIPTGLGKTSIVAIWLLALAENAPLPRRLAYVVNRRTVVDQTTDEVRTYRERLLDPQGKCAASEQVPILESIGRQLNNQCAFPSEIPFAISTLRGQHADNSEWSVDPARPAVICGTVDMIGSRLLFSGYRVGFKGRPLHAGFLGQDALLVHDEAHLEPAFEQLVRAIASEQEREERKREQKCPWPRLRVMSLSATTRGESTSDGGRLALEGTEYEEPIVRQRIEAGKKLVLHSCNDTKKELVSNIVEQALAHEGSSTTVLVYLRSVEDVLDVVAKLESASPGQVCALTGTTRGLERDNLIRDPVFARFLAASSREDGVEPADGTVFLVCTSAGEVGVNISADHLVCDLSTWDSMAQRFGRVHRFGEPESHVAVIDVVHPETFDEKAPNPQRKATLELLRRLDGDASPKALTNLSEQLSAEEQTAAFSPVPRLLPVSDILFDKWAMTSIRSDLPGRPPVAPYLHGIAEWEPPRTSVAWRNEVACVTRELIDAYDLELPQSLLDDFPLKPHEILSETSERVYKALKSIATRLDEDVTVWLVDEQGQVLPEKLGTFVAIDKKQALALIADKTILLPPSVGALSPSGTLDGKAKFDGSREDRYDVADLWTNEQGEPRRKRIWSDTAEVEAPPDGMALIRTLDTKPDAEEFEEEEVDVSQDEIIEEDASTASGTKRFWHWFVRPRDASNATLASAEPVTWQAHTDTVTKRAQDLAEALPLDDSLKNAIVLAAELHDLGKRRELWQRSIGNPNPAGPEWYAKPGKPKDGRQWRPRVLSRYRHEFGSLLDVLDAEQEYHKRLEALPEEMRDVVLHLIAAHHGYARPHFPIEATIDPNHSQSVADDVARDSLRRYSRLERRFGRWGLAYLESLLRAADWAASAGITDKGDNA